MSKEIIICGKTQEQIDALKKKYGAVFHIGLKDMNGAAFDALYREPDETVMKAVKAISASDEIAASTILFDNCCLACDDDVKKRLPLKMKVVKAISDTLLEIEVTVKNL